MNAQGFKIAQANIKEQQEEIQNLIEENQRLQRENENLKATRMGVYQREKRLEEAEEELAKLKEENLILPLRYYIDEDIEERVFDTDEMESEFHDALVDLGAYNDELECEGCHKQFGKTESSFQNAEGLAVCVDCFKGEESGEE